MVGSIKINANVEKYNLYWICQKIQVFLCIENVKKIETYASMRNADICAILSQTHFRNVRKLTELRGLPGA